MDYNEFSDKVAATAKLIDKKVKTATVNTIARAMSEIDPDAKPVIKKVHKTNSKDITTLQSVFGIEENRLPDYGYQPTKQDTWIEYETDSDLRDTEKIPVKEDIYQYFQRDVRPYVADAWINLPPTKTGCEISFNKYFYKSQPLRTLEENEADILQLDAESKGFIESLFSE